MATVTPFIGLDSKQALAKPQHASKPFSQTGQYSAQYSANNVIAFCQQAIARRSHIARQQARSIQQAYGLLPTLQRVK